MEPSRAIIAHGQEDFSCETRREFPVKRHIKRRLVYVRARSFIRHLRKLPAAGNCERFSSCFSRHAAISPNNRVHYTSRTTTMSFIVLFRAFVCLVSRLFNTVCKFSLGTHAVVQVPVLRLFDLCNLLGRCDRANCIICTNPIHCDISGSLTDPEIHIISFSWTVI